MTHKESLVSVPRAKMDSSSRESPSGLYWWVIAEVSSSVVLHNNFIRLRAAFVFLQCMSTPLCTFWLIERELGLAPSFPKKLYNPCQKGIVMWCEGKAFRTKISSAGSNICFPSVHEHSILYLLRLKIVYVWALKCTIRRVLSLWTRDKFWNRHLS